MTEEVTDYLYKDNKQPVDNKFRYRVPFLHQIELSICDFQFI